MRWLTQLSSKLRRWREKYNPNPMSLTEWDDNTEALCAAAQSGDLAEVKRLIPLSNPLDNDSEALQKAAAGGHVACVRLLLPVSDPQAQDGMALYLASSGGFAECVRLLAPHSDAAAFKGSALTSAVFNDHHECVAILAPLCGPEICRKALLDAVRKNSFRSAEVLWPYVNEKFRSTRPLANALERKQEEMIAFLIPRSNLRTTLTWMRNNVYGNTEQLEEIIAQQLNAKIHKHIGEGPTKKTDRKM